MFVHFATHVFGHVHVGQAVQGKDVALLPVLVDLGESQFCCTLCHCIFTRALLPTVLLHRCGTDMHAPQRQQQRQQRTVLHGKGLGMTDYLANAHTLHTQAAERDAQRKERVTFYSLKLFALAFLSFQVNITIAPLATHHTRNAALVVLSKNRSATCKGYTMDLISLDIVKPAVSQLWAFDSIPLYII